MRLLLYYLYLNYLIIQNYKTTTSFIDIPIPLCKRTASVVKQTNEHEQKLESQIEVLKEAGAEEVFQEKFTGTTVERPQFNLVLKKLENGDTLIVTKLDRLARNTREVLEIVQSLFNRGIKVHILNIGLIDNTPTGQLIFTIFSAFAQFERDLIVTRTQEGKNFARVHDPNFKEGRPQKFTEEQIQFAYELKQQGMTYKMIERKTGISVATQKRRFLKII